MGERSPRRTSEVQILSPRFNLATARHVRRSHRLLLLADLTHSTSSVRNLCRRMSRFPARCCVMEYETILFSKKKTTVRASGNHPDRPGNIHLSLCAKHHHV